MRILFLSLLVCSLLATTSTFAANDQRDRSRSKAKIAKAKSNKKSKTMSEAKRKALARRQVENAKRIAREQKQKEEAALAARRSTPEISEKITISDAGVTREIASENGPVRQKITSFEENDRSPASYDDGPSDSPISRDIDFVDDLDTGGMDDVSASKSSFQDESESIDLSAEAGILGEAAQDTDSGSTTWDD